MALAISSILTSVKNNKYKKDNSTSNSSKKNKKKPEETLKRKPNMHNLTSLKHCDIQSDHEHLKNSISESNKCRYIILLC